MKLYTGIRGESYTYTVTVTDKNGKTYDLPVRNDLVSLVSDERFGWSYAGSGPSALALAIVADVTGNDIYAVEKYKEFRDLVIKRLVDGDWKMSEPWIREFV